MNKTCKYCGELLQRKAKKFCSNRCRHELAWIDRKTVFEQSGIWPNVNNDAVIARHIKRYLKETRGVRCEICNNSEWCGKEIPLVLDHVAGNASNNKLTNLRLVCGNCDMQLPTYKSKNYGNGRFNRRMRYQQRKSY